MTLVENGLIRHCHGLIIVYNMIFKMVSLGYDEAYMNRIFTFIMPSFPALLCDWANRRRYCPLRGRTYIIC